jgi:hypothetical protein
VLEPGISIEKTGSGRAVCRDFVKGILLLTPHRGRGGIQEAYLSTRHSSTLHTSLCLGLFLLFSFSRAHSQAATPPPAPAVTKPADSATNPAEKKTRKTAPNDQKPAPGSTGSQPSQPEAPKPNLVARLENARLDAFDSNYESISLTDCIPGQPDPNKIVCTGKTYRPKVTDLGLRANLKLFHIGDHLRLDINDKGELQDLRGAWSVPNPITNEEICVEYRLLVLAACALALFLLATAATLGKPLQFIIGMDHRYSNSKFQIAIWFWVLISTYLATVVFRVWFAGWNFFGAVSIPQHLLELSGLSAITYGGAKAITTAKVNAAMNPAPVAVPVTAPPPTAGAVPGTATPSTTVTVLAPGGTMPVAFMTPPANLNPKNDKGEGSENFFKDLVQNDKGGFDFGDFQMLMVTFVAVGMYLTLIFHYLGSVELLKTATLPDVDTTILASFGIGQGAYLAKKAGGNVGTT